MQLGDDAEDFDLNFLIDRHAKVIHLGTGATSPHFLLFNFTPKFGLIFFSLIFSGDWCIFFFHVRNYKSTN